MKDEFNIVPELTGSRFICASVYDDKDWDYLLQVKNIESEVSALVGYLHEEDFKFDHGEHYQLGIGSTFLSFRKDQINFLVSSNADWCNKHRIATKLSKKLKLEKKEDRIAVFQALLYGNVEELAA